MLPLPVPTVRDLLIWVNCPDCGQRVPLTPWTLVMHPHYRGETAASGTCVLSGQTVLIGLRLPEEMLYRPYGY